MDNKNKKEHKICLMGCSFNTGNMGVSALAASLVKIFTKINTNTRITFLIGAPCPGEADVWVGDKNVKVGITNYRLSPKAKLGEHLFIIFFLAFLYYIIPFKRVRKKILKNKFLKTIYEADFIGQIHGGDSFSDIYGILLFFIIIMPNLIVLLLKKKLILLPQTYGPYKNFFVKSVSSHIIKKSTLVLSRDNESIVLLKNLLKNKYDERKIFYCPDVAFTLNAFKPHTLAIRPQIENSDENILIGLNINGLMYNGGYTGRNMFKLLIDYKTLIHHLIEELLQNTNAHILLIPHTYGKMNKINSDPNACREILESFPVGTGRLHMVEREYNQNEIKGVIGLCHFFIGSRMHSCIAALSQGIPTIGIAYSKKFLGVFNSINKADMVLDCRSLNEIDIINKVFYYFKKRDQLFINIQNEVKNIKDKIETTFLDIFS